MRSTVHFVGYNFKRLFTSPRPYFTLLLIFSVMQVGLGGAKTYLIESGQRFQAVELYVFAHSSRVFQLVFILGLLLLLGDAPFLKEGMSFRLIRTNRFQWLLGQFLSCVVIGAAYLLAIELLFLLLFIGHVSFQNEWSEAVILAAQIGNGMVLNIEMAVSFSMKIIKAGSPYAMFGLTLVYSLLLYTFFSALLIVCNLRLRSGIGCLAVMAFWCLRLALAYKLHFPLLQWISPCNLACLDEQILTPTSILYTIMFFSVSFCCLGVLALRFTHSADLLKGDYA